MYVILCGNPIDGLKIYGPFEDDVLAHKWAEDQLKNIGMDSWWCVDVIPAAKPVYFMVSCHDKDDESVDRPPQDWIGPWNTLAEAVHAADRVNAKYDTEIHKCERIK